MMDLNCYIATFNCGRKLIDVDYFATNFFAALTTNLPPDLIVLALEEIAPIGYSFLGGSYLAPYFSRFTTAINAAAGKSFETENEYETTIVRNVGLTAVMVFSKSSVQDRLRWIETAGVGVGAWDIGNKGAVGVRLALESDDDEGEDDVLTFVGAHLAPMEDAWEARNEDWRKICEGLVFERDAIKPRLDRFEDSDSESEPLISSGASKNSSDDKRSLFSPISHVYFLGDLNYRTSDTAPKAEDYEKWPQPVDSISDIRHYGHLLKHDQLNRERSKNKTLHNLAEAEIDFPPTYKYSEAATKRAIQSSLRQQVNEDDVWLWAKHRVPSWCDRILYLGAAPPEVHAYTALAIQPTSDHRPVALSCSIPSKSMSQAANDVKPPFTIRKDWREARAAAKRYELIVGWAAYLSLTWEGEALLGGSLIGAIGGWLVLRSLLGT